MKISGAWLQSRAVQRVCSALAEGGFQALFVGGVVRNSVLNMPISDIDMASDAPPHEVMRFAELAGLKVIPTGIEHGTITVISEGEPFEITTFRRDVETNGRHAVVAYSTNIADDAARRDFTMNALYARADGTLIDPLGIGLQDALNRHLRFVGDPAARIAEDYLRILRFFRFYAWYGNAAEGIDPEAFSAISEGADGLAHISKERIGAEVRKLLAAPDPAPALAAMQASGVLQQILPGADAKAASILVHLEEGSLPNWLTRLSVLGCFNPQENLRLSRSELKELNNIKDAQDLTDSEAGYRYGEQIALQARLALHALLEQPLNVSVISNIKRGAEAQFPLKAADLMPELEGAEIGKALKTSEALWVKSGFSLSRDELLARL